MRTRRSPAVLAVVVGGLLTSGCDVLGQSDAERAGRTETTGAGPSWIVLAEGKASPSPAPRPGVSPAASPALRLPPMSAATAAPSPTEACAGVSRMGAISGLTVEPGSGRATVSWYNAGDPGLLSYQLAAVPQRLVAGFQPEPEWQTIDAGAGCRQMSATVAGLETGAPYVFWLDAVTKSYQGSGTRASTVGRSLVVTID
jgi:hypothetical protein